MRQRGCCMNSAWKRIGCVGDISHKPYAAATRESIMQNHQKIQKKNRCPICCTSNSHLLWCVNSYQAARHFVLQERYPERFLKLVSHIADLWGQNTCEVVQCDKCGFIYSNPYIAGDERFYSLAYVRSGYPTWKWEFQLTYDVLSKCSIPNCTLLEIGAGDGAFVRKIAEMIISKNNIVCTEFSEYGRRSLEKFGIRCLPEDVRNLNSKLEESFNIICMFQVLEHMDRLDVLFLKLNSLLKKGGSLFIAVPNPKRIQFNELNEALLDMPPNHIGRWNKNCFEEVGKRYGFQIKDYSVEKGSLIIMAKQFVIHRFMRKSQQKGSLENRICKIDNFYLCRIMKILGVAINSIIAIPMIAKMNSGLGNSQWVHFVKE